MRNRIDPQVRQRLDQYVEIVGPGGLSGIEDIPARRRRQAELQGDRSRPLPGDIEVRDHSVPCVSRAGDQVPVRAYRPRDASRPSPCILYLHGGGMVSGSVAQDDGKAAGLARATGCVVVSVDYRLAPENPHPAALDDCLAGLAWTAENHEAIGVDPDRVAIYGSSAGGCLAAAVALVVRDRGGPGITLLMLVSPMLDDRSATPSALTNTGFGAWSREANLQAWRAVLGPDFGTDRVSSYAAPARAERLGGLPPTYIDVGDLDLFRDEALAFAGRLARDGVPLELHVYPGGIHGGESLAPDAELTSRVRSYRLEALGRALRKS